MSGVASSRKPLVVGGKLKLKGSNGSSSKRDKTSTTSSSLEKSTHKDSQETASQPTQQQEQSETKQITASRAGEYLTTAQKRHLQKKIEREELEAKKLSKTSFRERVDIFNDRLSQMTEHNDIPRISAAGNG